VTVGRVALIVLGTVGALLGLALLVGGGFLLWADRTEREDGYLTTPTERFVTSSYALTRTRLEVDADGPAWLWNDNWFGKIRVRGESAAGKLLFIGIAPEPAVARYLGDVAHANVEDIEVDPFRVRYRAIAGGPPQGPPTAQHFWAVSASGVGQQTVTWEVREGDWSVVLMNADGSRGVVADVDLGAKLSFLLWLAVGLLLGGGFVLVGSAALIILAARRRQAPPMPPAPASASSGASSTPASEYADRSDRELRPD
jgi:hypothetical protein